MQGYAHSSINGCVCDRLVAGHELGGVVPGVVARGVSQVLVQVGDGALQGRRRKGGRAAGSRCLSE
jgi:hypothetical protein